VSRMGGKAMPSLICWF